MSADAFVIETSPLGRVVIAPHLPDGTAVAYTTFDIDGRLNGDVAPRLTGWIRDRFGIDATLTTCNQVHGRNVRRAAGSGGWSECDSCDALWSDETKVALGIKVADCLPVSMVDPIHRVIANVHSGWRGTAQQITDEAVSAVEGSAGFDPAVALAYLGPAIRACCFEVGEEVVQALAVLHPDIERFVDRSRSRPHVDVAALTAARLVARGFDSRNIFDSALCTRCDGSIFHSYRRDRNGGRNLALVAQ